MGYLAVQEICVRKGSTGEVFLFRWREADGTLVTAALMSTVTLAVTTLDGDALTPTGATISAGSVPTGYSFGWRFGTEIAAARRLFANWTVTKIGGGPVKLGRTILVVEE